MTTNTCTPSAWDNPSEGVQVPIWHPLGSATPSAHETLNDAYRHLIATDTIQLWLAVGGEYTILGDDWETSPTDQPTIALDAPTAPEHITLAVEAANFFCKETWAGLADATMDMVDSERRANDTLTPTPTGEITLNGTPINSIHVEEADFEYPGEPEHGGWRVPSETCHILLNHLHQLWETITYTAQTLNTPIPESITNTAANLSIYAPDAESSIERIGSWALAEWEKHPDKSDYVPDDFGSESLSPFSVFTETIPQRIYRTRDVAMNCARSIQNNLYTPRSLNPSGGITAEDVAEPPF